MRSGNISTDVLQTNQSPYWFVPLETTFKGLVTDLNAYRPYLSLTESGVGYGGNRVSSLQMEKIVWELSTGQSYQLVAPIDIDADLDP
ncbi:MAG: hypothetical protein KDA61_18590 [Planctomycetales bacterium]|nr:hypothetical protein [Planctomycetales bacterium]MCA9261234.1 hypothetical protein [Planctomycetales bacterium]